MVADTEKETSAEDVRE